MIQLKIKTILKAQKVILKISVLVFFLITLGGSWEYIDWLDELSLLIASAILLSSNTGVALASILIRGLKAFNKSVVLSKSSYHPIMNYTTK